MCAVVLADGKHVVVPDARSDERFADNPFVTGRLDDVRFYAACREVLAEGGVMSVNLFGRDASFDLSLAQIVAAFGAAQVCRLRATREGNSVVLAGRDVLQPDRATLLERAATIEARYGGWGLPARKWLRMLRPLSST